MVFNMFGYQLMIAYWQQRNDAHVEARIDQNQYSDGDLISIKVSLNLPYYTGSKEFERIYGSINIDGVDYEYVKRRVYADTLEVLCLPNFQKTKLNTVSNEITKAATDVPTSPAKKSVHLKTLLPDCFVQQTEQVVFASQALIPTYSPGRTMFLAGDYSSPGERPPQFLG